MSDCLIQQALSCSRPHRNSFTGSEYWNLTPLVPSLSEYYSDRINVWLRSAGAQIGKNLTIIFDLDDTLLSTDYAAGDQWHPDPWPQQQIDEGFNYSMMRRSFYLTARNGWRLPRRYCYCPKRYPFLVNPVIIGQWRPGVWAFLQGLQESGANLYLATASAVERVQFLRVKFPIFNVFFPPHRTASADRLLLSSLHGSPDQRGNFFLKTPEMLQHAFSLESFDLLVDDSLLIATYYRNHALQAKLVEAEAKAPHSWAMVHLALRIARKLNKCDQLKSFSVNSMPDYPEIMISNNRFEDPTYWVYLHDPTSFPRVQKLLSA